jgi:hypothetical protein
VPVSDDDAVWPSPETVAVHDANGLSNPPAGTLIEKRIAEPVRVPETDPRPLMPVAVSVIVTVPENDVSDCESCHDIGPAPVESAAEPLHVPLTFTDVDGGGGVGAGEPPPPLQPLVNASASTTRIDRPLSRR